MVEDFSYVSYKFNEDGTKSLDLDSSYFLRKTRLHFEGDRFGYRTYHAASEEDWSMFLELFKDYLKPKIAPSVTTLLNEMQMTAENQKLWSGYGTKFIQNAKKIIEESKSYELNQTIQKDIERISKQKEAVSLIQKTELHNGRLMASSKVHAHDPSGDSLFDIVGISRGEYIKAVSAKIKSSDMQTVHLIEWIMKELNADTIEEWAESFDNPNIWPTYSNMDLLGNYLIYVSFSISWTELSMKEIVVKQYS